MILVLKSTFFRYFFDIEFGILQQFFRLLFFLCF